MTRRTGLAWTAIVSIALCVFVSATVHAASFFKSKKSNASKDDDDSDLDQYDTKDKVPLIGQYTQIVGQNMIRLEGAGLVVGLDGTGEDPPPSLARQMVLEDMKRRGVANPSKLLKSPNVAIVLVTAYLPPLVRTGDQFDVEVTLPTGSKVKSLNGGYLMETYLAEHVLVPGQGVHNGKELATARGPILVSSAHENTAALAGVLRRGRIVAGGKSKTDRDLALYLRNDFRSERNAVRIASAIGRRFFEYDKRGEQVALAEAKTDQQVKLKVLSKYRDNYPRYLDVIRKIAFRETEVARQVRMKRLKWELLDAETSGSAALELEAIGDSSAPILKPALKSKDPEVRYNAAVALAYLGDNAGLDVLADAARNQYAFRIFALAAMASFEDPEVYVKLRELLDADSAETRYGAFRALTTLNANDPFVHGRTISDQFKLHVLATAGPPMVHLTNCKKTEVVVFGADQEVRTPLFARAGTCILVSASAGSSKVRVSRFAVGQEDQQKNVSTRLEDVILAITDLGATFPDVAQFLMEANAQHNLAGRLEIDALPRAGRFYDRSHIGTGDDAPPHGKKRVGNSNSAPNLFSIDIGKTSKKDGDED
ncbi:MAG TPA: flagellar basal body P-ring protein FlgI, partial [Planctomycetaceae bacterium]|nr:flagellar basal body P-ring protein FlgI [Planctomycetaceae bacterium]